MSGPGSWQFWIDRGGTFTDVVARRPDGSLRSAKLLSEDPGHYDDAAAEGARRLLAAWRSEGHPDAPVEAIKMGTTVATNALLERRGTPTLLVVTKGFGDAVAIGYQNRPDIFALHIVKPDPIYAAVLEVDERVAADGNVLRSPDEASIRAALAKHRDGGLRAAAVCLLHGYRYPEHERAVAELAQEAGFEQVSVSHDVEALIKFVSRSETTLADAYLTPVLNEYIARLRAALTAVGQPRRLMFMQSNGGLADADRFRGKDSVLSGPAGGVVGMVEAARSGGLERLVGFDMGGTSTDVSAWSGEYERSNDSVVAGVRLRAPMMRIHTIAAGGGSVLRYADGRYQVGPASAGADPGPACYRRGGPLTVTDANLLLGRLVPAHFPQVFGPDADQPLDETAVRERFRALATEVAMYGGDTSAEQVAAGFLAVADESMANAIRKITIERGEDVRDFTLCCFGGAGGQHACRVAEILGMQRIWLHPLAGVLSAYGMGLADVRVERQRTVEVDLHDSAIETLADRIATLVAECDAELDAQRVPETSRDRRVDFGIRVPGSDTILGVPSGNAADVRNAFGVAYQQRFGALPGDDALIIASIRVAATGAEQPFAEPTLERRPNPHPVGTNRMWSHGEWHDVPVFLRDELGAGARVDGPAILIEANATTVIDDGWEGHIGDTGHLLLQRRAAVRRSIGEAAPAAAGPDPVRLEVFNRLFMHIAEQMGVVLQNTALSVNIRERLDFSCALFDADGQLVSNAPHMPVHLGSMGESVRAVIGARGNTLHDGDAVMLNSPYKGGTHLPDITVVTPWFAGTDRAQFYLASRAHHADVGGMSPGSMPSDSTHIEQEGVLIENFLLVDQGALRADAVRELLASSRWPARNPGQNLADLGAQLAANRQGIRQLEKAIARYGLPLVQQYLGFVRENAAASVRRLLGRLRDGSFDYELDSGERIRVRVSVDHGAHRACIDFDGTSPQSATNFNAPEAVTRAAVLYVFRSLIAEEIPMNEGCLDPLEIRIPAGSMLSPSYPAAVVAGNVETSQCVTDALFGALNALAASQGTMNNLTFGNARVQYYETICGGAGAGPGFDGADAVHTHMTNSRLTDPEVLEQYFPVRVESFAIRRGSGGAGRWRGGDGVVRQLRFTEPVDAAILSNHRRIAPFGLDGGGPAKPGVNRIVRADGREEKLSGCAAVELEAGDLFVIETPGGGGYGSA